MTQSDSALSKNRTACTCESMHLSVCLKAKEEWLGAELGLVGSNLPSCLSWPMVEVQKQVWGVNKCCIPVAPGCASEETSIFVCRLVTVVTAHLALLKLKECWQLSLAEWFLRLQRLWGSLDVRSRPLTGGP